MTPLRARLLLVVGLLLGAVLAAGPVLEGGDDRPLPAGAVARVGERLILRDEWQRAVAAVASERRTPLDDADRRAILERLIDEALLVRHGLDLDLVTRDPRLRGQLVDAVMQVTLEVRAASADRAALHAYYAEHADRFRQPPRLQLSVWREDAAGVRQPFLPPVPDALLPPSQLRQSLGPTLTARALALAIGESARVMQDDGTVVGLELRARESALQPSFEAIEAQVRSAWQRDDDEAAVRELLVDLRDRYPVVVAP